METDCPIEMAVGSSTLVVVPALHFLADFALKVNRACCDPARRPNAIAVELGPLIAAAAHQWLGELGIGPAGRKRLPCMLGLTKRNRHLRSSARERAMELQRETGNELEQIPPTLLQEELGCATAAVLVLSPTDSIVEAIRCARELDVPLYGVDLEETANPIYPQRVLPDPAGADRDLSQDLRTLAASTPGDPEVDPRREFAMAARLKGLLQRHGRVLFTGGMGHWNRIEALLSDGGLRPSVKGLDTVAPIEPGIFRRSVIHPAVAVGHMDVFPAVALAFERRRRHPLLDLPGRYRPIRREAMLQTLLRRAYTRHFRDSTARMECTMKRSDWSGIPAFEQLLRGQTLLNQRSQPTLAMVDTCARATLTGDFCTVLRRTFSEFPWVDPKTLPGCGYLRPPLVGEGTTGQLVFSENEHGSGDIQVPVLLPGGSCGPSAFPVPDAWRATYAVKQRTFGYRFTWRPWEDLINGLCAMAIAGILRRRREPASEPYGGQLLDGLDVKATLRAHSRGEEQVWVRDARLRPGAVPPELPEGFPVVWIFDEDPSGNPSPDWSLYFEPADWLANFSGDPAAFRRLLRTTGDGLIDLVTYGRTAPGSEARRAKTGIGHDVLSGLVVFSPIFPTYRQTVSWYRTTGASRNPVAWCWGIGRNDSLIRDLAGRADPALQSLRWQDLLIGMVIPFSGRTLIVVAPPGFRISPVVAQVIARRGKNIRLISTSSLPAELMGSVVNYHTLPGRLDDEGRTEYIRGAEQIIGEPMDRYRRLVPLSWRTFGLER
jgi:hypothetical protein